MDTNQKSRPIIFNSSMVKAILDGHKTQTRRIVKPVSKDKSHEVCSTFTRLSIDERLRELYLPSLLKLCPYGRAGDILWVRETWRISGLDRFEYKAAPSDGENFRSVSRWKPSIHMPKSAARIFLEIKDIRVERLNDISDNDCLNEGIRPFTKDGFTFKYTFDENDRWDCMRRNEKDAFRDLWEEINGIDSWDANSWVWVVEFSRREKP